MAAFYTFLTPVLLQADEAVDDRSLARLMSGEVVVEDRRVDESGGSVRAQVLVHATAEEIWRVISSCIHARRYIEGMEECEVLVDQPDRALTHHVVDPGWLVPKLDYQFEIRRRPYSRMDFELTEGNLRQMEGYWRFETLHSGVLVEHEIRIRPKAPAPRWLVRYKLRESLPAMLLCIRALADGSLSDGRAEEDLAACQSPAGVEAQ